MQKPASMLSNKHSRGGNMNQCIESRSDVRELKKLLGEITSAVKNTLSKCIAAGKLMSEIKRKTKYGDWGEILETVDLSNHTADRYMMLWEHRSELALNEVKTITDAGKIISEICNKKKPGEQTSTLERLSKPTA